ncbi:MAG: aldo/keto reductase [Vicinamibacterales bacterium]|nr:aldo/keto reductase [Vicinamibacterales bacterium]
MAPDLSRRDFVKIGVVGAAGIAMAPALGAAAPMPERPLGRTGHNVRLFSLGGQATIEKEGTHDTSLAIINRAIDLGVNYIDTAAGYGRGISQMYIGEVMATRRKEVFLATKTRSRERDGALRDLEQSLKSLKTDHIDLWQIHNVMRDEEVEQILGKGGAIEAMLQARDQKMIRFIGITGHFDPAVLVKAMQRFEFDAVLMALNPADKHRLSFIQELLPLANEKKMGVIGMKIPARGRIFKEGAITSIKDPMRYVLTLPVSTVIIGCDTVAQLEENVKIAQTFTPMSQADMARLEGMTASYESDAAFFKKKPVGVTGPDHLNWED